MYEDILNEAKEILQNINIQNLKQNYQDKDEEEYGILKFAQNLTHNFLQNTFIELQLSLEKPDIQEPQQQHQLQKISILLDQNQNKIEIEKSLEFAQLLTKLKQYDQAQNIFEEIIQFEENIQEKALYLTKYFEMIKQYQKDQVNYQADKLRQFLDQFITLLELKKRENPEIENLDDFEINLEDCEYALQNMKMLQQFFQNFKEQITDKFIEFTVEDPYQQLSIYDFPQAIREILAIDDLTLHSQNNFDNDDKNTQNYNENEEFLYSKINVYKVFMDLYIQFLDYRKETFPNLKRKIGIKTFFNFFLFSLEKLNNIIIKKTFHSNNSREGVTREGEEGDQDVINDNNNYNSHSFSELDLQKVASLQQNLKEQKILEKEIKQNLKKYESMLLMIQNPEERDILQRMIKVQQIQLSRIQKMILSPQQPLDSKRKTRTNSKFNSNLEEFRKKHLLEIFKFYCQISNFQHKNIIKVFDNPQIDQLSWLNFLKFTKQFKIIGYNENIQVKELGNLYKRHFGKFRDINYSEFVFMLENISQLMFDEGNFEIKFANIQKFLGVDDPQQFRVLMHEENPPFFIHEQDNFRYLPSESHKYSKINLIPERNESPRVTKQMKQYNSRVFVKPVKLSKGGIQRNQSEGSFMKNSKYFSKQTLEDHNNYEMNLNKFQMNTDINGQQQKQKLNQHMSSQHMSSQQLLQQSQQQQRYIYQQQQQQQMPLQHQNQQDNKGHLIAQNYKNRANQLEKRQQEKEHYLMNRVEQKISRAINIFNYKK